MKVTLKGFQTDAVAELRQNLITVQGLVATKPSALLLNAPTGSGKTLMATALIDELLDGSDEDGSGGDPDLVFVWLTDDPELNKQTVAKMLGSSSVLTPSDLVVIDAGLDAETLAPGRVYFLNTQKLGSGTSFVKHGDGRTFTLWETLSNSIKVDPTRFVLILDEAHRGARGKEAVEAETIMQKFMKGNGEIEPVPLVLGISATPDRFVKLCNDTGRPLFRVDVDTELVRESGLLKEYVDLFHPDEEQPNEATMLVEAISAWKTFVLGWAAYGDAEQQSVPSPVLLVQVQDAKSGAANHSTTDLAMVVGTLAKEIPHDPDDPRWIAHAFQDDSDLVLAGHTVRRLAPSAIDADPHVKVVLFKTSLNTGWDCPRAETMVSFRSAKDETNIAQLVGRMVRAPLARRIDANEHLNTVALFLPYYDRKTVEKVVARLTTDVAVPPTEVRAGKDTASLTQAVGSEKCFEALAALPTYTIPRVRVMKAVPRLAKLAALLADLSLVADPIKSYRASLVAVLIGERDRLAGDVNFKKLIEEGAVLDIRRRRLGYAVAGGDADETELALQAAIADQDVEALFANSGRLLGEALHKEYLRNQLTADADARMIKLELHALVSTPGVLDKVTSTADTLRKSWIGQHKAAIRTSDERHRQTLRDIEASGADPEATLIEPQPIIEGFKVGDTWDKHLYVDASGKYHEDFKSSWERRVVEAETKRSDIVGWLRNQDRKPWSLCVPRRQGSRWRGIYPDFFFFRKTGGGVIVDIVDPHLLSDENAPGRAAALAAYAQKHSESFGRIELVIFATAKDTVGKRLDLIDEDTRNKVASVTSHAHLQQLFDAA